MSSTSSNTEEFTYNELMEQYVKATRLIEHLKSQRDRSKRAFDKAMDLVLKYDARIAELEAVINIATNQSNNLRPCPFCGNEPVVEGNLVACNNLNCPTYDNYWTDPMIFTCDQWNTRPIEGALHARIAELELSSVQIQYMSEDELPKPISYKVYSAMYPCSKVDFVRMFPFVMVDGDKCFLIKLPEREE